MISIDEKSFKNRTIIPVVDQANAENKAANNPNWLVFLKCKRSNYFLSLRDYSVVR